MTPKKVWLPIDNFLKEHNVVCKSPLHIKGEDTFFFVNVRKRICCQMESDKDFGDNVVFCLLFF